MDEQQQQTQTTYSKSSSLKAGSSTKSPKNSSSSVPCAKPKRSHNSTKSSTGSQGKCFISIWSTIYCFLILTLNSFILKKHGEKIVNLVNEYTKYSDANEARAANSSHFSFEQLKQELVIRASVFGVSIVFLLLFAYFSLRKCSNYANDNIKFGRDFFSEHLHGNLNSFLLNSLSDELFLIQHQSKQLDISLIMNENMMREFEEQDGKRGRSKRGLKYCINSFVRLIALIWHHFLTLNAFFHLLSTLVLVIFDIVLSSEEAMNCTFRTDELNETFLKSNKCFFFSLNQYESKFFLNKFVEYRLELISLVLAMATMYIRYANVFWLTNKTLSFLITLIGFMASVQQLLQLYSFVYISKQIELSQFIKQLNLNDTQIEALNTTMPMKSSLILSSSSSSTTSTIELNLLINDKLTLLILYVLLAILVYLTATPAYVFAYLKYKERYQIEEVIFSKAAKQRFTLSDASKHHHFFYQQQHQQQRSSSEIIKANNIEVALIDSSFIDLDALNEVLQTSACCFSYCPHLIATIQLIMICACKMPFCYDYIIYYNNFKDFGIMLNIIYEILHTIILLFIWLILTLKNDWSMHLQTTFSICHLTYHFKLSELKQYQQTSSVEQKRSMSKESESHDDFMSIDTKPTILKTAQVSATMPSIRHSTANIIPSDAVDTRFLINRNSLIETMQHRSMNNLASNEQSVKKIQHQMDNSQPDYLLNSATLYRNEIRKSIRNILKPKPNTATTTNSSSANRSNQSAQQIPTISNNYQQTQEKQLIGTGLYLNYTPSDSDSTFKIPTITKIVASSLNDTNQSTNVSSSNTNSNRRSLNESVVFRSVDTRPVLYLDKSSSSTEYESRV